MTFTEELKTLCAKHNLHLSGTLRVIHLGDAWDAKSRTLEMKEAVTHGDIPDNTGPFLVGHITQKPVKPVEISPSARIHINSDIAGYDCPVTGKWIDGRTAHRENLKRRGCRNLEPGESRDSQKHQRRALEESCKRTAREMVAAIAHQVEI